MPKKRDPVAARESSASFRIFEGPDPNRPSFGRRVSGREISFCEVSIACQYLDRKLSGAYL